MNDQQYYRSKLKEAVEGILSGKLEHNQQIWHCRSAHCVLGWYEILTLKENEFYDPIVSSFKIKNLEPLNFYPSTYPSDHPSRFNTCVEKTISNETGYKVKDIKQLAEYNNTKEDIKRIWERMN